MFERPARKISVAVAGTALLVACSANAALTWFGEDIDGGSVPSRFADSQAARSAFLASAGFTGTESFESYTTGDGLMAGARPPFVMDFGVLSARDHVRLRACRGVGACARRVVSRHRPQLPADGRSSSACDVRRRGFRGAGASLRFQRHGRRRLRGESEPRGDDAARRDDGARDPAHPRLARRERSRFFSSGSCRTTRSHRYASRIHQFRVRPSSPSTT